MDYLIECHKDGRALLGSDSAAVVRDAKNMIKVRNRIRLLNPIKKYDSIVVYSFTNLYDEKTHKHVLTIQK